jgi:hypothetical protein
MSRRRSQCQSPEPSRGDCGVAALNKPVALIPELQPARDIADKDPWEGSCFVKLRNIRSVAPPRNPRLLDRIVPSKVN